MEIIIDGDIKLSEFYIQTFSLLFFPEDNTFSRNKISKNKIGNFINIFADKIEIIVKIC